MDLSELEYDLPERLIAQQALPHRSASRLLILDRRRSRVEHRIFGDLIDYLQPGDCLVINNSKVIPARFLTRRASGGIIEGLFLKLTDMGCWQVLLKNASRLRVEEMIYLQPSSADKQLLAPLPIMVVENQGQGIWQLLPQSSQNYLEILDQFGLTPLPPYIHREKDSPAQQENLDRRRYQTVYADQPGSVAAPTAGLHFTAELMQQIRDRGIIIAHITLHVGLGTFQPVTTKKIEEHHMHIEQYEIDDANAELINRTLQNSARVIAVGTTTARTLETAAHKKQVQSGTGETKLLITPGYEFQVVSVLLTNFHLPRTTLLALVCAFAGTEQTLSAYREAIKREYRFYSYGDAMLIY